MITYIVRRILTAIPLLLIMSFITFCAIRLPGGDVLAQYRNNPQYPQEFVKNMEHKYHFDRNPAIQYFYWLTNIVSLDWPEAQDQQTADGQQQGGQGDAAGPAHVDSSKGFWGSLPSVKLDLGYSFINMRPVTAVIGERLLNTLMLSVISLVLIWAVAIPIGTYSAVKQYSMGDKVLSFIAFIGMSVPSFFLALVLLYLVSLTGMLPIGGLTSPDYPQMDIFHKAVDLLSHMVVPAIVIITGSLAGMQRLMRGNMLEVLRQQYVTTARAKGLPERRVIFRHAMRNALNPMITIFGYQFSGLLSGVALTEIITSYPGMGSLMLDAVRAQDIYLVMASVIISGSLLVAGNLLADILLAVADPRISYD